MAQRKRKQAAKKIKQQKIQEKPQAQSFRWGESYTSLLLGIIVVIIGVLFFISLVKSSHTKQVTSIATNVETITSVPLHLTSSVQPSITQNAQLTITPTQTKTQINTPTPTPTNVITPTLNPATQIQPKNNKQQVYIVESGDDLWHIAEKFYNSGYNWIDIAKANNLDNPGMLFKGTSLVIPQVTPSITTVTLTPTQMPAPPSSISMPVNNNSNSAITTDTYEVQKGDNLWNIAVRAYSNGYKWTDIASANNLVNPSLIHSGNILKIPR